MILVDGVFQLVLWVQAHGGLQGSPTLGHLGQGGGWGQESADRDHLDLLAHRLIQDHREGSRSAITGRVGQRSPHKTRRTGMAGDTLSSSGATG
jgi:hypothetical protein